MEIWATGITGTIGKKIRGDVVPLDLDLTSPLQDFRKIPFNQGDQVINFAGVVGTQKVLDNIKYAYKVNVEGPLKLGMRILEIPDTRLLHVSTSHVYMPTSNKVNESDTTQPISEYAKQKLEAENRLRELFRNTPERLVILRIFSIISLDQPDFTLGGAIRSLMKGETERKIQCGDDVRDFISPETAATSILDLAHLETLPSIVNICSGVGNTVKDIVKEIAGKDFLKFVSDGTSSNPIIVGDNKIAKSLLPNFSWKK